MKTIRFNVIEEPGFYAFVDYDGEIFYLVEYHIPLDQDDTRDGYGWVGVEQGFLADNDNLPFKSPLCAITHAIDRMATNDQDVIEVYKFNTVLEMHLWIAKKLTAKLKEDKGDEA